ncbi:MAG: hypothetical protein ACRDT6_18685, partial [Micromonosporaceae bacterium]
VDTCPEGVMIRWLDADYMREDGQRTPELQLAEDRQHDLLRGILHDAGHTTSTYRYPGIFVPSPTPQPVPAPRDLVLDDPWP